MWNCSQCQKPRRFWQSYFIGLFGRTPHKKPSSSTAQMKPSPLFLVAIFLSVVALNPFAKSDEPTVETSLKEIMAVAEQPMEKFVATIIATNLPALPEPGSTTSAPGLTKVRDVIWKRISDFDFKRSGKAKEQWLVNFKALCRLRQWLNKTPAYSNLAISSRLDVTLSTAVIAELASAEIQISEAKQILEMLPRELTAGKIISVARQLAPESARLTSFQEKLSENKSTSLVELAVWISGERNELIDGRLNSLMAGVHLASMIDSFTEASGTIHLAQGLIAYAEKGGNLNAESSEFLKGFTHQMPEWVGKKDPVVLMKLDARMYEAVLENAREWTSKKRNGGRIQ